MKSHLSFDLRIKIPGVERLEQRFRFYFEGRSIEAYAGESIAAALIAAGEYAFRVSADSKASQRGMFCGMGICGECQVLVNGESRRACMEKAESGIQVQKYPLAMTPAATVAARAEEGEWLSLEPDVLVVGAGPAGLSAAIAAAESGLKVVLVDERQQAGGQYYKQPPAAFSIEKSRLDRQFREGIDLVRRAMDCGIQYLSAVTVVGAFEGRRVAVASAKGMLMIRARRIVIATGAYERPVPFPGWTLPGVMTTGAAQTLLRGYQIAPGQRVLVAGNGPLNLQVASELSRVGVEVVAVAELAPSPFSRPLTALRLAMFSPQLGIAGIRHIAELRRCRVPLLYRHTLIAASGDKNVNKATLAAIDSDGHPLPGSNQEFDVDAVCVNFGFVPQSELARALGCSYRRNPVTAEILCERTTDGRSGLQEVFVVGDAGGLGGAKLATAQGALAGMRIALDLDASMPPAAGQLKRLERQIQNHRRFQDTLWKLFSAPLLTNQLATPETLVCRCESLSLATIERAVASDHRSLAAVKKLTRVGMGRCQGRYCTASVNALLGVTSDKRDQDGLFAPRPPIRPLPIKLLAGWTGPDPVPRDLFAQGGSCETNLQASSSEQS